MKSIFLLIAILQGVLTVSGQMDKPVESKISSVTVFLNQAQITRETRSHIDPGKTNLIITGLPSNLDPQSIQVAGKGSFIILGINHRQNFLHELNLPRSLKLLKDSIDYFQKQVATEQSQIEILNKEEQLLLSNQKIGGVNQNLNVADLKSMADFFRSRMSEIFSMRMKEEEKIKKSNARIARLQLQLNAQNELYTRNTSEIVVSISAQTATPVELEVKYVVANAGWSALYDLRALNTQSPIQLNYKASVRQNTGEDWTNVRLRLSTATPDLTGLKPELTPWFLSFDEPRPVSYYKDKNNGSETRKTSAAALSETVVEDEAKSTSDYFNTLQTTLTTEFDISLPYTVPSSSKPIVMDIRSYEVKANYKYAVTPRLDADAFLMAQVTGWEEYSLLPGEANIFFEGTFVGKTFINAENIKDTLMVSLGRDKRIVVKREKLRELTSRKVLGMNQKESYAWQITVRNTKAEAIKIVIEDEVPVSQNNQIEVAVSDMGGAKYDKDTGKLTWEVTLQPNESKKIVFKYEVKYPKDKRINGL